MEGGLNVSDLNESEGEWNGLSIIDFLLVLIMERKSTTKEMIKWHQQKQMINLSFLP